MKVKIGGSAAMKIMVHQYEPIDVSSTLEIEKEFEDSDEAQSWIEKQGDKINQSLQVDLEKKVKIVAKKHTEFKKKVKEMI